MKAFVNATMPHLGNGVIAALLCSVLLAGCGSAAKIPAGGKKPAASSQAKPAAPTPDKGDPQARLNAGLDLMKSGDIQEAEKAFVELTKDFPEFGGPWTNLGILYAKSKRRDQALSAFTRASQLNANNAVAFNWLGILSREGGDYARARQSYERALQITPNDALTRLNYGILLDQYLKQPQAALEQYKQYLALAQKEDLRVIAWIAQIEAQIAAAQPAPAAAAPAAGPATKPAETK